MTLFDDDFGRIQQAPQQPPPERSPAGDVVRVLCDVPAMDRVLDYRVPDALIGRLSVGSVVRVPLHGRRVRGWVLGWGAAADGPARLEDVAHLTGMGPDAEVIELSRWAAWRWAGRLPHLLRVATPERAVQAASRRRPSVPADSALGEGELESITARLLREPPGVHVLGVSPTSDPAPVALRAARAGQALIVAPQLRLAGYLQRMLSRAGASVARWPDAFALAAAGHTVVGGRSAVWAPLPELACVVVFDEHDEGLQNESSPTWHAREVALERARRAGVPALLVSPCPSLEAMSAADSEPVVIGSTSRRAGWPPLQVVDRRDDDPRTGLFSSAFVDAARATLERDSSVLCVLNRKGRARLLACRSCSSVAECAECGSAVHTTTDGETESLRCPRCGTQRPVVCLDCASSGFKVLRAGITRAGEELEAMLGETVVTVSATGTAGAERGRVLLGTEAALHRARDLATSDVGLVAFLDFDQELLAPRYRAAEEALALLVRAARVVGGRDRGAIVVQTRKPAHPVLEAALLADPAPVSAAERVRRELLGLPPVNAVAAVGGEAAAEWIERFGRPEGIEVSGPRDGWWLLRAQDSATLADACASVARPAGRLRLRVDPVRLP